MTASPAQPARPHGGRAFLMYLAAPILVFVLFPLGGYIALVVSAATSWARHEQRWVCVAVTTIAVLALAELLLLASF